MASYFSEIQSNPRNSIITLTGPGALTRAVWSYAEKNKIESEGIKLVDSTKGDFNIKDNSLRYLDCPYYGLDRNKVILKR